MKKNISLITTSIIASSILIGCSSSNDATTAPVDTTAPASSIDKAYGPALFYSNITPSPNATIATSANAALDTLKDTWLGYKNELGSSINSTDVSSYYARVDAEIDTASTTLETAIANDAYPADIMNVHLSLENVRDILGDMRVELGVDYLMDKLTDAHHAMEAVSGASKQHTDGLITDAELCVSLGDSFETFNTQWGMYANAYDQTDIAALYSLSTEKSTNLSNNINALTSTLSTLNTGLANCDANVASDAAKIKPVFVKMFMGYADFIRPFTASMVTMEQSIVSSLYCTNNPPDVVPTCGGLDGVKTLLSTLETNVNKFQSHYPVIPGKLNLPATIYWNTYFDAMKASVTEAQATSATAVDTADFASVHENVEDIRTSIYNLRSTYENYAFVMDSVTDYHHKMEEVLGAGGDATTISGLLVDAKVYLAAVDTAVSSMNVTEFGFDEAWRTAQKESIATQTQNLDAMEAAIAAGDTTTLSTTLTSMKTTFIPLFKSFGTF